mgnify:CR=1 FL=1
MLKNCRIIKAKISKRLVNESGRYILVGGVVYIFDFLIFSFFVFVNADLYIIGNIVARISGALLGFFFFSSGGFVKYFINKQPIIFKLLVFYFIKCLMLEYLFVVIDLINQYVQGIGLIY